MSQQKSEPDPAAAHLIGFTDILAGSVRGVTQVLVGHPLDTVKIRLQTQDALNPRFNGVADCLQKTLKDEGFKGFYKGAQSPILMCSAYSAFLFLAYGQAKRMFHDPNRDDYPLSEMINIGPSALLRGMDAAIVRNIPGSIVYFYSYETIKHKISSYKGVKPDQLSPSSVLLAGGLSGMIFWLAIFPLDVVKSRIQVDSMVQSQRAYTGIIDCIKKTYVREGIGAFYKGFKPCIIRAFPTNAASFLAYEFSKDMIKKMGWFQ